MSGRTGSSGGAYTGERHATWRELVDESTRALAERVIADPTSPPEHVQGAIGYLSTDLEDFFSTLTPAEVFALREVVERIAERQAREAKASTPDDDDDAD